MSLRLPLLCLVYDNEHLPTIMGVMPARLPPTPDSAALNACMPLEHAAAGRKDSAAAQLAMRVSGRWLVEERIASGTGHDGNDTNRPRPKLGTIAVSAYQAPAGSLYDAPSIRYAPAPASRRRTRAAANITSMCRALVSSGSNSSGSMAGSHCVRCYMVRAVPGVRQQAGRSNQNGGTPHRKAMRPCEGGKCRRAHFLDRARTLPDIKRSC